MAGARDWAEGLPRRLHGAISEGRVDVLIMDDWAVVPVGDGERRDFLDICDAGYQVRLTMLTRQLPVSSWQEQIEDPTIADSILYRLVH